MIPTDPEDRDLLAGEYVLGTLDARQAAMIDAALPTSPELAAAIAAWEARLAPLSMLAPPEAPPPDLWDRIAATLPPAVIPARAVPPAPVPWAGWRLFGLGASTIAAGLAAFLVLRPPVPAVTPPLMTVLLSSTDQPAWLVEAEAGGALRLAALNPRPVQADRVFQLWALPQGATAPTSLGLIPPEGRLNLTTGGIRPEPGMLIEITLEPPGGSPTGRPTGPIQFIGRLTPARGT